MMIFPNVWQALDAFLDMVDETLDGWARLNGV